MQRILVAYDITDDARRQNVSGILEDYGIRLQKSLFECRLPSAAQKALLDALERAIDPEEDSLRFYFFCEKCRNRKIVRGRKNILEECGPVLFL